MWLTNDLLLHYQRCPRRSFLDLYGDRSLQKPKSEFLLKLQQDSQKYQQNILASFSLSEPKYRRGDWDAAAKATLELMRQGADCIYQGVLLTPADNLKLPLLDLGLEPSSENYELAGEDVYEENLVQQVNNPEHNIFLVSNPDLLVKHPGQSNFGDWMYIPTTIKFGRRPKQEYQIAGAFHALVLANVQGVLPESSQLILRYQKPYAINLGKWLPRLQKILNECIETLLSTQTPEVCISRQRCNLCRWYNHCYRVAQSQQHLSLLPGVTPSRYEHLQTLGLTAVESLASANPTHLEPLLGETVAENLVLQAQSTVHNRAILKSTQAFYDGDFLAASPIEIYFDIEAEQELNVDYLLGVLVVDKVARTENFYPLLAENPGTEELIWQQFLDLVGTYPNAPIFHFSPYEADTVKRLAKLYNTPASQVYPVLARCVDLHERVTAAVMLPVEGYSLKSIATWLGFEWRDSTANGAQSVCWYDDWLETGDRAFLDSIVRYNEDDCRATYHLKNWLANFLQNARPTLTN